MNHNAITLAMTGASGAPYGLRLLEFLLKAGRRVYLMVSAAGQVVLAHETDLKLPGRPAEMEAFFNAHYGVKPDKYLLQIRDNQNRVVWQQDVNVSSGQTQVPQVVLPKT